MIVCCDEPHLIGGSLIELSCARCESGMRIFCAILISGILIIVESPCHAAVSTTCLCRSADGKSFVEKIHRHHRWACDFKLGYVRDDGAPADLPMRPTTQTCNAEEIAQFKVWLCFQSGCTYQYSKSVDEKNRALERIELLRGERNP
jgi:hypothetical protein